MKLTRVALSVVFFVASTASATTFERIPTDRELAARSDLVVIATVGEASSRLLSNGMVVTDYRFDVEEALKGPMAASVTVTEIGGVADGRFTVIADSATYQRGERVLAFLRRAENGTYFTTSMTLGKFTFARTAKGDSVVVRDSDQFGVDGARFTDGFKGFVRGEAVGDYTTSLKSIAEALHPKVMDAPSSYCIRTSGNLPLRWPGKEVVGSSAIIFYSSSSDVGGGIFHGAQQWTNDPIANISLNYQSDGFPPGTSLTPDPNDANMIYLNYTNPGTGTVCDGVTACTFLYGDGNTHTFGGETFGNLGGFDVIVRPAGMGANFSAVIAHELGHSIGLRDSNAGTPTSTSAVMFPGFNTDTLQAYDQAAVETVYGPGPPCGGPPAIQSVTGGGNVPSGSTATLHGNATPSGFIHYHWFDGVSGVTQNPVGTDSSNFTTPPITTDKNYWLRVTNDCGGFADSQTVTVHPVVCNAPSIAQQPQGGQVNSGGTLTLTVTVSSSSTTPLTFQWYEGQKGDNSKPQANATSASFTTPPLTQSKSYWVSISNSCGSVSSETATITIIGQCTVPVFLVQPVTVVGTSGRSFMLFATATGSPTYQWYQGAVPDTSTPVTGAGGPSNARWVDQLYVDLLGRRGSSSEVATFTGLLGGGTSRQDVALQLLGSDEYRSALIGLLYQTYLRRNATSSDVAFWLPAFTGGLNDQQVTSEIMASPEYFALSGGTFSGWLNRVYQDILARGPSAPEIAAWNGFPRTTVVLALLNSAEGRSRRVGSFYIRFLRRAASGPETAILISLLQGGGTDEQAIAAILASDEYYNFDTVLFTPPLTTSTSYWVRASNTCGSTNSSGGAGVALDACIRAPQIVTQPSNVTGNVGDPVTLSVVANNATSYQWYRASSGDPSNPISGGTGPSVTVSSLQTGSTNYWVKVANACGSTNSATAAVTINCSPSAPVLSVPPVVPSSNSFFASWTGDSRIVFRYELQESTTPDFTGNVSTFNITDGSNSTLVAGHTVTTDTRFYHRIRLAPLCGGFSSYSNVASVIVIAPVPDNAPGPGNIDVALPACAAAQQCSTVRRYFIAGFASGGGIFNVTSDKSFVTVSPSTGPLPPEGVFVNVTINTTGLDFGSAQATLIVTRTPGAAKSGAFSDPPTTGTVPVSVSVVAPVSPVPKGTNAPLNTLIIPAVAHADGINSRFVSDVRISNTALQAITYDVSFTPQGTDGTTTGKKLTFTAQAGQTIAMNDVVKNYFGSGVLGDGGIGSLEIRPTNYAGKNDVNVTFATVAASRTYNVTSTGTFGQFIPALPIINFLAKSATSVISMQQIANGSGPGTYRTNLGLIEGAGQPVDLLARLLDDQGTLIAQRTYSLKPYESQQVSLQNFFNGFTISGSPLQSLADARVEMTVSSDNGRLSAYSSVLDNATNDPLLVFPVDPSKVAARRFVVPGVAELNNGAANFHTDMRIYNASTAAVPVTLNFSGSATALPAVQRTLAAGEVWVIDNVLPSLWQTTGGGAVIATTPSDAPLVVTARTFSRDDQGGTFGQFIPGVTATDAVGAGERSLQVVQLEESPSFRSNLGLVEVTGNPVTIEVSGFVPESKIAVKFVTTLSGGQFAQFGNVFTRSLGFPATVYNGRISVRAIGGTGRIAVYGSVVDNRTQDPTYVPAQ